MPCQTAEKVGSVGIETDLLLGLDRPAQAFNDGITVLLDYGETTMEVIQLVCVWLPQKRSACT